MNPNETHTSEFSRFERLCTAASLLADSACRAIVDCPQRVRQSLARTIDPQMSHDAHLAYVDEDTGLPNKRAMHKRFSELLSLGEPFAAVMIDINKFKLVNELLGHSRADEMLAVYADKIQHQTRVDDQLFIQSATFRTGGDEFVILAPLDARRDSTLTPEERLYSLVERLNQDYLEVDSVMCTGEEMAAITATAYGEVVDPCNVSSDDMSAVLNDISLSMLAQKRA